MTINFCNLRPRTNCVPWRPPYYLYEVYMSVQSKDIKWVPKFRKWSRDLSHAHLWVKFSYSDKGLYEIFKPTKFGVPSFIRSKVMERIPNFKLRSRDPDHAHFRGKFVVHWLARVIVNVYTKYEVSIFGHSKDIKGSKNFVNGHVT